MFAKKNDLSESFPDTQKAFCSKFGRGNDNVAPFTPVGKLSVVTLGSILQLTKLFLWLPCATRLVTEAMKKSEKYSAGICLANDGFTLATQASPVDESEVALTVGVHEQNCCSGPKPNNPPSTVTMK